MKMNKWPKLFNNKNFLYTKNSLNIYNSGDFITRSFKLSKIINHNLNFKKYIQLTNFIKKITFIKKEDSLLDFGSGNGAFLYFFINRSFIWSQPFYLRVSSIKTPLFRGLWGEFAFVAPVFLLHNSANGQLPLHECAGGLCPGAFTHCRPSNHSRIVFTGI